MATKTEQQLVPLGDLAGRLTASTEGAQRLAEAQGGQVAADWAGRPSVTADIAQRTVDAYERDYHEQVAARRAYNRYAQQWREEREEAGRLTYETAHRKTRERSFAALQADGHTTVLGHYGGSPADHANALQSQRAALETYDRKHPLLTFEQWRKKKGNR